MKKCLFLVGCLFVYGTICAFPNEQTESIIPNVEKNCPDEKGMDMTIDDESLPGFTIYRPSDLKAVAKEGTRLPVVVFGNGACTHNSSAYIPMLSEMVANGYIVIAVGAKEEKGEAPRRDFSTIGKDDNLLDAVDWICRQNSVPESDFYHLVDIFHIAVGGHSCGGAQALAISYDPRVSTTIMFNAGMGDIEMAGASSKSLEELHAPVLYLIGGPDEIAYANAVKDFSRVNHVPIASVNYPVGHGGTYHEPRGGLFGKIALMWLNWQLKGESAASAFFTNSGFRDENYPGGTFESKGIQEE